MQAKQNNKQNKQKVVIPYLPDTSTAGISNCEDNVMTMLKRNCSILCLVGLQNKLAAPEILNILSDNITL